MATYNNIKKLKIGDNIYNLYDSGGTVTGMTTTAGTHTAGAQTVTSGVITTKVPTKTSHLTNDSDFVSDANYVHTDNNFTDAQQTKLAGIAAGAEVNVNADWNATSGDAQILNKPTIPTVPTNVSAFTNDAGYITGYTETDPVFSASVAAGITSTDISNWNAKVSDDKTWNGVALTKAESMSNSDYYLTGISNGTTTSTTAKLIKATTAPEANRIPKYTVNAYLQSTTPDVTDNSRKVATTEFVKSVMPTKTTELENDSQFVTAVELTESYETNIHILVVNGSTASLYLGNSLLPISLFLMHYLSVAGVLVAQVLNNSSSLQTAQARAYQVAEVDATTAKVRLVSVDDGVLYTADLQDTGDGLTGTFSSQTIGEGGGSYTATSPIDITNDVISHETSGVTAGTYDGGGVKDSGFYIPSFTVDTTGHVTSATDLGTLIPEITTSNSRSVVGGVISPLTWSMGLRSYQSSAIIIPAGNTTSSVTISSDSKSGYSYRTYFRVADVQAYDASTYEPVIVDWTTNKYYSGGSTITLTISIASAYTNDIIYYPILTYAIGTM